MEQPARFPESTALPQAEGGIEWIRIGNAQPNTTNSKAAITRSPFSRTVTHSPEQTRLTSQVVLLDDLGRDNLLAFAEIGKDYRPL